MLVASHPPPDHHNDSQQNNLMCISLLVLCPYSILNHLRSKHHRMVALENLYQMSMSYSTYNNQDPQNLVGSTCFHGLHNGLEHILATATKMQLIALLK